MKYRIKAFCEIGGYFDVEAENRVEALGKAEEMLADGAEDTITEVIHRDAQITDSPEVVP